MPRDFSDVPHRHLFIFRRDFWFLILGVIIVLLVLAGLNDIFPKIFSASRSVSQAGYGVGSVSSSFDTSSSAPDFRWHA